MSDQPLHMEARGPNRVEALQTAFGNPTVARYLSELSGRTVDPQRQLSLVLMEAKTNSKLLKCDAKSIVGSMLRAASVGLTVGGPYAEAYLVPFKGRAQLIISYMGMVNIAHRHPGVLDINARAVHENDEFSIDLAKQDITHRPPEDSRQERGEVVAAYAVATLAGGGTQVSYFDLPSLLARRESSAGYRYDKKKHPWATNFGEMAKKTAVRSLFKLLPKNGATIEQATIDSSISEFDDGDLQDVDLLAAPAEDAVDAEVIE